jgi:magnesium-transporting ATPase (P-type)
MPAIDEEKRMAGMSDLTQLRALPENPHALSINEVLAQLGVSPENGLTNSEALARLATYGHNTLRKRKTAGLFTILLNQFKSAVVWHFL